MPLNEIAASLYPWDLADEGVDRCLDNLQSRAECNSAYLVGVMHKEKRPLHQRFYQHNPVRKFYLPEDSRVYWKPDPARYRGPIKPITSARDFLRDHDWLDTLIGGARARGMRTGCEVSHTIIDAEVARSEYPETLQRDVYGDLVNPMLVAPEARRALPCLNNPAVRDYLVGLFTDLAANHDIDFVQTCLVLFSAGGGYSGRLGGSPVTEWHRLIDTATGGCFCSVCEAAARAEGLDWEQMRDETRWIADIATSNGLDALHEGQMLAGSRDSMSATALLMENPAFTAWLQFRIRSVTKLFETIHHAMRDARSDVEFRYNTYVGDPEMHGLDFLSAFSHVDSVRESDYSDQRGTLEGIEIKRQKLFKARRALGYDKPLLAALGVRPNATPEILRAAIKIAVDTGCDGLSLGHYDGATMERLDAVKQGLAEAEAREPDWRPLS